MKFLEPGTAIVEGDSDGNTTSVESVESDGSGPSVDSGSEFPTCTSTTPSAANGESTTPVCKKSNTSVKEPGDLCCPISLQLLRDPVIISSGNTYERECILHYFRSLAMGQTLRDPLTNKGMKNVVIVTNWDKRRQIQNFLDSTPDDYIPSGWDSRSMIQPPETQVAQEEEQPDILHDQLLATFADGGLTTKLIVRTVLVLVIYFSMIGLLRLGSDQKSTAAQFTLQDDDTHALMVPSQISSSVSTRSSSFSRTQLGFAHPVLFYPNGASATALSVSSTPASSVGVRSSTSNLRGLAEIHTPLLFVDPDTAEDVDLDEIAILTEPEHPFLENPIHFAMHLLHNNDDDKRLLKFVFTYLLGIPDDVFQSFVMGKQGEIDGVHHGDVAAPSVKEQPRKETVLADLLREPKPLGIWSAKFARSPSSKHRSSLHQGMDQLAKLLGLKGKDEKTEKNVDTIGKNDDSEKKTEEQAACDNGTNFIGEGICMNADLRKTSEQNAVKNDSKAGSKKSLLSRSYKKGEAKTPFLQPKRSRGPQESGFGAVNHSVSSAKPTKLRRTASKAALNAEEQANYGAESINMPLDGYRRILLQTIIEANSPQDNMEKPELDGRLFTASLLLLERLIQEPDVISCWGDMVSGFLDTARNLVEGEPIISGIVKRAQATRDNVCKKMV